MTAYFDRFEISMTLNEALSATHPGPCDDDVEALSIRPKMKRQLVGIDDKALAEELREYGAWDETELADREANERRILWLAAGQIVDNSRE